MDKDLVRIRQMIACCEKAILFCEGYSYSNFLEDLRTQDACIKNVEELGEKASRITKSFQEKHSEIQWSALVSTRNILVHDYDGVDLSILWEIIRENLPELLQQLRCLL